MAEKFLYFLGAGASAQALPIVKKKTEWRDSLPNCMEIIAKEIRTNTQGYAHIDSDFFNGIANNLEWLASESRKYTTIDTYAKFLHLNDREKLRTLKTTLSTYFFIEQIWYQRVDPRYLVWLTSVLSYPPEFPDNIKILTWNYDSQMQLTAEKFRKESIIFKGAATTHRPPLIRYFPNIGWSGSLNVTPEETSLFHLNGMAGFYYSKKYNRYLHTQLDLVDHKDLELIKDFIENTYDVPLDFAWESVEDVLKLNFINKMISDTTIMIVIGYSFPFFNRDIDKKVFDILKSSGKLKKIYFQDPKLDGSFLKNQFDLEDSVIIKHIEETDAFYIPFEM